MATTTAKKAAKPAAVKAKRPRKCWEVNKPPDAPKSAKQILDAIGEDAVFQMIQGGHSIRKIALHYGVHLTRLYEWLSETPERHHAHARAKEEAADAYDDMALDVLEKADRENIAVAKEIASHYRWRAKAANPKKYSDKLQLDATVETKVTADSELIAELAKLGLVVKGTS